MKPIDEMAFLALIEMEIGINRHIDNIKITITYLIVVRTNYSCICLLILNLSVQDFNIQDKMTVTNQHY